MLLLMDGFWHVLGAAPLLLDLLAVGADPRLLVTNREAIQVYGELDYPIRRRRCRVRADWRRPG